MLVESIVLVITAVGALITGIIFSFRKVRMSKCMGGTCIQKVNSPTKREIEDFDELRKIPSIRNSLSLLDSLTLEVPQRSNLAPDFPRIRSVSDPEKRKQVIFEI